MMKKMMMKMMKICKTSLPLALSALLIGSGALAAYADAPGEADPGAEDTALVEKLLSSMTLDDKISQMIMPAVRSWDEENLTDLSACPELEKALRAHQYGGIILFRQNITDAGQVTALIQELQVNNLKNEKTNAHIPYFMAADEEGGIVVRLSDGTRMTGNMAIGATGEAAAANAAKTGRVLGEEMAAAGFNIDFAPVIDVNNNAANPVIGTRSFSDDPDTVATLGEALMSGLSECGVIGTYKHFPGHGDTAVDSHIGTPSVEKTYDQIKETELVPFAAAIEDGAEMIMTAHITYPLIDDEVVFGDGETKGFYPATMSKKIITDILRGDLGYDGVVVTDALEMDAIRTAGLVPGEEDSTEYRANVAQKVIDAGIDILLLPCDMNCADAVSFYDDYIQTLAAKVEDGTISEARIDESVTRILKLKEKYGILDPDQYAADEDEIEHAKEVIGSAAHHETEMEIAKQAITLLKNENAALPLSTDGKKIVFLGRQKEDAYTIRYALSQMKDQGVIEENVTFDYYFDPSAEEDKLHYTDELRKAISEADVVVGLTKTYNLGALEESSEQYRGIAQAIEDTHAAGGRFVLLSNNLPYDAARFQDADAILLAYMGSGLDMDPTERALAGGNMGPYNANVVAAVHLMFGDGTPNGILPVQIPEISISEDGSLAYADKILYERGFGLNTF